MQSSYKYKPLYGSEQLRGKREEGGGCVLVTTSLLSKRPNMLRGGKGKEENAERRHLTHMQKC